jgi:hypothetical protein
VVFFQKNVHEERKTGEGDEANFLYEKDASIPNTSVTTSMKDSNDSIDGDGNDDDNSTSGQDEESTKKKTRRLKS